MNIGKLNSYFGEGTVLKGSLKFKGLLRFDGDFEGDVQSEDTFIVGATGKVRANVKTGHLYNFGSIVGDVEAVSKISLHAQSDLEGNIKTPVLITEEMAFFQGSCYMPAAEKTEGKKARSSSRPKAESVSLPPVDEIPRPEAAGDSGSFGAGAKIAAVVALAALAGGGFYFLGDELGVSADFIGKAKSLVMTSGSPSRTSVKEVAPTENAVVAQAVESEPSPEPVAAADEGAQVAEAPEAKPAGRAEAPKSEEERLAEEMEKSPDVSGPALRLASLYLGRKEYRKAIELLEKTAEKFPSDNEARAMLAAVYHRTGREKEAYRQYKMLAEADPESIEAKNNQGFEKLEVGALGRAEKIFKQVLKDAPDNYRARLGLATVYSKQEENDKAIRECRLILEKEEDYAPAQNRLAWIYAKQRANLEEARELSIRSMAVFKNIPEYIDTLSEVNFQMGKYDEAIRLIKQAIELVPGDSYYERQLFKFQRAKRRA